MRPGQTHTNFTPGKRLLVLFRDGKRVVGKYVERTRRGFILEGYGEVLSVKIRSATIYKPKEARMGGV